MSTCGVINLEVLDLPEIQLLVVKYRYCRLLKRMLDNKPINLWSGLTLGNTPLTIQRHPPCNSYLYPVRTLGSRFANIGYAFKCWKKLIKQVQCPVWLIKVYPNSFTMVEKLRLFGVVDDAAAIAIRDNCPRLKQLSLNSCGFSINALSIILDGHKILDLLDTSHGFCVANCEWLATRGVSKPLKWNGEEIRHKADGIQEYLMCDQRCVPPYRHCFLRPYLRNRDMELYYGI